MPHPIVLQMNPSPDQEPAITARDRDIVVTAGAGTGKTRTLVARYLALLAEGLPLRSIFAITFTRKAAREMRNRVRDEMRRYLEQPGLTAPERHRWQGLYAELDAARIGTIHSLCTEILRAHPAEAEVDPSFQVTDEPSSSMLHKRALEEAMAWAADKDDIVPLFGLLGERRLRQVLERMLQKRLDVDEAFVDTQRDWLHHWKKTLDEHQDRVVSRLQAEPLWLDAVAMLRENSPTHPDDRIAIQRRYVLSALESSTESPTDNHGAMSCLGEINLIGGSRKAWPGGQEQLRRVKGALRALRDLWKRAGLTDKVIAPLDEELAQAMPALRTLFQRACHAYFALKRNQDALDFDDLEQQALALLQRDASVRTRWQSEARAILVDEFQDTNGRQRDLVSLLNGNEGKLFVVGDAKQSIYRFRGADVSVFRAERDRIAHGGGWVFSLDTSYRAHRSLIQGLNDLLRPVLGEQSDPDRPWAEPFAELKHARTEPASGCEAPYIEMILATGAKSDGALDRAACAVSNHIVELSTKDVNYGDVAILCRASTSFQAYEEALFRVGIPFVTVSGRGFYHRPEIRDLLNALRALADPTDDLALVGLLRSPAFAFPDSSIYHLCNDRGDKGRTPLWDVLRQRGPQLLSEEGCDVQRFVDTVSHLHDLVGRTRIADVLKAFLDRTDYRAALIQAGQSRAVRNVAKLLADAHTGRIVGVAEFLEYVTFLRDYGAREGEARATAEGAVRIMTVHAAKGLEFPVVVIGDVTYDQRGGHGILIDPALGVLIPLSDDDNQRPGIYNLGRARDKDREEAELDRLLYVAATRAKEKLILSGCVRLNQDGSVGKCSGWLGKIAEAHGLGLEGTLLELDDASPQLVRIEYGMGTTTMRCTIHGTTVPRVTTTLTQEEPSAREASVPPPLLGPVRSRKECVDERTREQDREPARRVWRVVPTTKRPRAEAWVVGKIVHEALAAWRFPDDTFERWATARARSYGITDARRLQKAAQRSTTLLSRFQSHALFSEMSAAERRLHEVPYHLERAGEPETGIIDALYMRDGTWTVVEFKTDEVRDDVKFDALIKREGYWKQATRYSAAVERFLGQHPRVILCMLDYAGRVELKTHSVET